MTVETRRISLALLACCWFLGVVATAQQVPSDAVLRDFELTVDYLLEVEGTGYPKAKIYQSQRAAAILIRASAFESPVLLSPRAGSVELVSIMSLDMQPGGSIDILADAQLQPQGRFRFDGEDVVFSAEGHQARLKPRPPVTGLQSTSEMISSNPVYAQKASDYNPDPADLDALRQRASQARVKVFFGSWCPACKQYVPRMLKVGQLLDGSKIEVEYYGLPRPPFSEEPAAKAEKVSGVPTGIVYVGGREVGRIQGEQWTHPERALLSVLGGA